MIPKMSRGAEHKMQPSIELSRRLRWADSDATGRLHFPRIFEIVEEAESELLRSVGWPVSVNECPYDFPRVHLECRFLRMILHDAPFRLRLSIGKLGRTSICYDFRVFNVEDELAIEGTMTVVILQNGEPTEIPQSLRSALDGSIDSSA
jgi:acyl-CoA thioester hydrolase